MKKITLFILAVIALPSVANADPGLDAGAGRDMGSSQTDTFNRDKRLEVDKAQGGRSSMSNSRERSREWSDTNSNSMRRSNNAESSQSGSVDININALLLQEFINHYESRPPEDGMPRPQYVFAMCKPLTGIITEYPTLGKCAIDGDPFEQNQNILRELKWDPEVVLPRRLAPRYNHCGWSSMDSPTEQEVGMMKQKMDPHNLYVSEYGRCRILASKWVAKAGEMISSSTVMSEEDAKQKIDQAFDAMDANPGLWGNVVRQANSIWATANCAPTLEDFKRFEKPDLQCGVLQIDGQHIVLEGRTTLSTESIEGKVYKISMSGSRSTSTVAETGRSSDNRSGYSVRAGSTDESFREHRKSASLSKSRGVESSQHTDLSRKSDSSLNASPKE